MRVKQTSASLFAVFAARGLKESHVVANKFWSLKVQSRIKASQRKI